MASTFPTTVDTFSTPTANSALNSPSHSTLHVNVNNAITNAQTYMGMTLITQTTFTGTTVDVSNCFTSLYDVYRIVCRLSVGSSFLRFNLLASGSPITTASYYSAGFNIAATVGALNANSQSGTTFFNIFNANMAADAFFTQDLNYMPATRSMWTTVGNNVSNGDTETRSGGYHTSATNHDGFRLTSGATMTGKVRIYGYRQA